MSTRLLGTTPFQAPTLQPGDAGPVPAPGAASVTVEPPPAPERDEDRMDKPEIDFPEGTPPSELEIVDLTVGEGDEAQAGQTVSVHYVGVAHSTGEQFDASYDRGDPLQFRLGVGQVISGWDTGVQGMKVGGRRKLVIPAHLAYGDRGAGGVIKPGETLIFVVDLVDVR